MQPRALEAEGRIWEAVVLMTVAAAASGLLDSTPHIVGGSGQSSLRTVSRATVIIPTANSGHCIRRSTDAS